VPSSLEGASACIDVPLDAVRMSDRFDTHAAPRCWSRHIDLGGIGWEVIDEALQD